MECPHLHYTNCGCWHCANKGQVSSKGIVPQKLVSNFNAPGCYHKAFTVCAIVDNIWW